MSNQPIGTSVIDDNRAVSEVIGVVILFGFLILTLSLYQVEVVPQQNAETEFQHSGEVRNDLVELRASILQAGAIDQPQYQTVQLGTTYSTRVFSINPSAPAGTIRTSESYPITIAYESNGTVIKTIPTRFIEYQPGYNELDRSPTWYDASVLYVDARDGGGGIAVIEDQNLVDGGEVQITALQNEFRRSGTGRVTLELRPATDVTGDIPEDDLTVTVPTRLSEDDWEAKTDLPTDRDVYGGVDETDTEDIYNLTLNTTASNLTVDTVGVQEAPEDPIQNDAASVGNDNGDDDPDDPNGEPPLILIDGSTPEEESSALEFDIENTAGEDVTVTEFNISTPGNENSAATDSVDNIERAGGGQGSAEVEIRDGGVLGLADTENNFKTDGTTYSMNDNEEATVESDTVASVDMGEFNNGNVDLTYSSADNKASSDVTVSFTLEDGRTVEFYFRVTNVNA